MRWLFVTIFTLTMVHGVSAHQTAQIEPISFTLLVPPDAGDLAPRLVAKNIPLAQIAPKVEKYLRSVLGNQNIRVAAFQKKDRPVEVKISGARLGLLLIDEDEGDVSYHLKFDIPLTQSTGAGAEAEYLQGYLRKLFENSAIRVLPLKSGSASELYIGDEFFAIIFVDGGTYTVQSAILHDDLK